MGTSGNWSVTDDSGFFLSGYVALLQYICDKFAPKSYLYPSDAQQRAIVNHPLRMLQFVILLHTNRRIAVGPIFFDYPRTEMSLKRVQKALDEMLTYETNPPDMSKMNHPPSNEEELMENDWWVFIRYDWLSNVKRWWLKWFLAIQHIQKWV